MALGYILSRRDRQDASKTEKHNKSLPKSTSCFGRLASLTIQRKKSSISLKEKPLTIRRIYNSELDNMAMKNKINQMDNEDYSIDEILSPYEDNNYSHEVCSYIERFSEQPLEQLNNELPLIETIECSSFELEDIANYSGEGFDMKLGYNYNKDNYTPSSGSSIFEKADTIVFDDDVISHSTSRHSLLLLKETDTRNPNSLEIFGNEHIETGSIIDANIEIFRTPANRLNLKLVSQSPTPLQTPSPMTRNIISPTKDNNNKSSISFSNFGPLTQERVKNGMNTIEQSIHHENKNEIYKNEMALLVNEHKLILQKHENEINNLKKLLARERNINKILISGASKRSSSHGSPSKIHKTSNECIPIGIPSNLNQQKKPYVPQSSEPRTSPSPFWDPANKESIKNERRKKPLRGFAITPVLYHSNLDKELNVDIDKSSSEEEREKGRMDAYHALTSSNQNFMDDKIIDYAKLNNAFKSNGTKSSNNRLMKTLNYLSNPDFSSIFLEIHT